MKPQNRASSHEKKSVPFYWWDFRHGENAIESVIVERMNVVVATFPPTEAGIQQAEKLIADLRAGRVSEKSLPVTRPTSGYVAT